MKRKFLRRKYKRLAAAVAGAAIMSSALPLAHGAPAPTANLQNTAQQSEAGAIRISTPDPAAVKLDPVQTVIANAQAYGFSAINTTFSLLSQSGSKAIVKVHSGGHVYKVELSEQDGNWSISTVSVIGSISKSIYLPLKFFGKTPTDGRPAEKPPQS